MQSEGDSSLPLPRAWVAARVRAVRSRDATDVLFFRLRAGVVSDSVLSVQGETFESADSAPTPHGQFQQKVLLAESTTPSSGVIGNSGHWSSSLHVGFCRLALSRRAYAA